MEKYVYDLLMANNKIYTHSIIEYSTANVDMVNIHNHEHYEILYVCEGERTLIAEKKQYIINKNNVALIPQYILHRTLGKSGCSKEVYKKYLINFTRSFVKKISVNVPIDLFTAFKKNLIIIPLDDEEAKYLQNIMKQMLQYNHSGDLCDEQMFLMLLCSLLTFFAKKTPGENLFKENMLVDKIIRYMEDNFDKEITLEVLAKQFYISKYDISRIFKKSLGISFVECLTRIRIENARKMLENTLLSITKISELSGFNSSSDFARVFKKISGVSPIHYRKECENKDE